MMSVQLLELEEVQLQEKELVFSLFTWHWCKLHPERHQLRNESSQETHRKSRKNHWRDKKVLVVDGDKNSGNFIINCKVFHFDFLCLSLYYQSILKLKFVNRFFSDIHMFLRMYWISLFRVYLQLWLKNQNIVQVQTLDSDHFLRIWHSILFF